MTTMEFQNNHQSQISNTQNSHITSSEKDDQDKNQKPNSNLNKSYPVPPNEAIKNKLNMNSSLNAKADTNISLNEQKKKEQSDLFDDEDILYNDEEENELFREYDLMEDSQLRTMDDLKNINERIKNNKIKIEELKKDLIKLKEEKKKKQNDIMNLLSNKESIEEIYKNQVYLLNNSNNNSNNFNENTTINNDLNNLNNLINDNSAIHLNSNHNITIVDNDILNSDEDNFRIPLKEIKESDQKKYIEQVVNMFEDIFKKKDENINNSISDIIKNSYELFVNNNDEKNNEDNNEVSVNNFFSKMSLFIANQSVGKFPEQKINLLLRYLLKINYINNKLTKYIKFVNKKYKERKKEINDLISFLEKKNLNLAEKIKRLESNMKEYEENKMFFDRNNNEELSHEVEIEYEDGIDKNAEINYEDDIVDDNDYDNDNNVNILKEKEKEKPKEKPKEKKIIIKKEIKPINKQQPIFKKVENKVVKKEDKKVKQIILKDNDESEDKYLKEFIGNKVENLKKKEVKKNEIKKKENVNDKNNEKYSKIKYNNNEKNIINLDKNKRYYPTPQHHIKKTQEEINELNTIEKDHYNRVQRIMNSGPKYGIFGVNNYNPDNSFKEGYVFSPKKSSQNVPKSSNKIDKTVRIESRQNHNFIGIINMTKVVPIKKKKKDSNRKVKENKEEENEGGIKIINLEQDFKKEGDNDEEKEEDKIINNTSNSNSINNKEPNKNNNNKNEVQGYYLNIINSKKVNDNNNNNNNNKEEKENNEKLERKMNYKRSYKSTRTRELNLDNNGSKKVLLTKMNDMKNNLNVNNKISSNNLTSTSNNDINKRSHSISLNQNEEENNKIDSYRNKYKVNKIIMVNSANNNVSPRNTYKKKIANIPISKVSGLGNKTYNANTYEQGNIKAGYKNYVLNKNKK